VDVYPPELFGWWRMCYNHRAVEDSAKQGLDPVGVMAVRSVAQQQSVPQAEDLPASSRVAGAPGSTVDVSRYCPLCSERLESLHCKLICRVCGYYMSCSDYY
jgi:hypothetical protein